MFCRRPKIIHTQCMLQITLCRLTTCTAVEIIINGLVVSCMVNIVRRLKRYQKHNWLHEMEVVFVQSNDKGSSKGKALRQTLGDYCCCVFRQPKPPSPKTINTTCTTIRTYMQLQKDSRVSLFYRVSPSSDLPRVQKGNRQSRTEDSS